MGNETLRQLVREYSRGNIDRLHYREQRARLIDEITESSNSEAEKTDSTESESVEYNAPVINDLSDQMSSENSRASYLNIKILVATIALIALIVFVIMLSGNSGKNSSQVTAATNPAANNAANIISTFMQYNDWSSERVSAFVAGWQNLSEKQKQRAKQAEYFKSLVSDMNRRLAEQQALAQSGSPDAQQQAQSIKSLAVLLNVIL